jgi:hypothetical protein
MTSASLLPAGKNSSNAVTLGKEAVRKTASNAETDRWSSGREATMQYLQLQKLVVHCIKQQFNSGFCDRTWELGKEQTSSSKCYVSLYRAILEP